MTARITWAVAERVLRQLRRDPRTLGLLIVVPSVLMVILRYAFDGQPETWQRIGAPMLGLIPFITLFIVTSIAMLRERTSGTLERLMSMPVGKLDLLAGYGSPSPSSPWCRRPWSRRSRSARSASTRSGPPRSSWRWRWPTPCSGSRSGCS